MCDDLDDEYWRAIGATPWSGEFLVIEQCADCYGFRGRVIDPNSIPVVHGLPEVSTDPDQTDTTNDEQSETSDDDTSDDGDWLVR